MLSSLLDTGSPRHHPAPHDSPQIHRTDRRAADRTYHFRSDDACQVRTLSPLHLEKDVEFYEVRLQPGAALTSAAHYHGTREFVTVEAGQVRLTAGRDVVDLARGDSGSYPADVPHEIANVGRSAAVLFLVVIYR